MKVTAVVVTYNRLDKLKQCLGALLAQSRPLDEIIVINNCCTDGTDTYLDEIASSNPIVKPYLMDTNIGGAGGFERGVCIAVERGADLVWMMDDDTVPAPTAVEPLIDAFQSHSNVGFACSRVNWTDGRMHNMNKPWFKKQPELNAIVESITEPTPCEHATFVSVMVPAKVVRQVGLPIGEFFIWSDDIEYTGRIIHAGYTGLYVPASIVTHITPANIGSSITDAPHGSEHRFYYQMRNEMTIKRMESPAIAAFVSNLLRLNRMLKRIGRRADHREEFRREMMRGFRDGLKFKPVIKFPRPAADTSAD